MAAEPRARNLSPTLARVPPQGESVDALITRRLAILVGIAQYDTGFSSLPNASQDAQAVAELLSRHYGFELYPLGGPLLDGSATFEAIRTAVSSSLQTAGEDTQWLFYFAGHGSVVEERGYLLPVDACKGEIETYLPIDWLIRQSRTSHCSEMLILIDACYAGRALVRDLSDTFVPTGLRTDSKVRQMIGSGNPYQPVLDGGESGHSVFTQSLLDALEGRAGIHERDGAVRFTRLLDHLVFDVPSRLSTLGIGSSHQQPIGGNLEGNPTQREFVLHTDTPRLTPETVQDLRSDDPSRRLESLGRLLAECRSRPELRTQAVELAVRHMRSRRDETVAPLVTRTLRYEPTAEVRAQAATVLGDLEDEAAVGVLIEGLGDEPVVCRAAASALGRIGDLRAVQPLVERVYSADNELLLDLVAALGKVDDLRGKVAALGESLRRGQLVPFIGPDFPARLTGLPDRATLAHGLATHEGNTVTDSLASAASATMGRGQHRFTYTSYLLKALSDELLEPGAVHVALTQLESAGAEFWISGAYDRLLARALQANIIVTGGDTESWLPQRSTLVCLAGDLRSRRGLLVTEKDYEQLRENEGDRRLLTSYLRNELQGKVVLFLGFDPANPDFLLLVRHTLTQYLSDLQIQAFLIWPDRGTEERWGTLPIHSVYSEALAFIQLLVRIANEDRPKV